MKVKESILDAPKDGLDPFVWQQSLSSEKPILSEEAYSKISNIIQWAQQQYNFKDLSVYIIGSICSNSYSKDSDIDIDFCAKDATEDDNDEDVVKEFGWAFKKNFIDNYAKEHPEDAKIGAHPIEVYFNPNPFQCFMSIGCYNVLENKWEVGPTLKSTKFDPISEYYADAMKQVDKILKDIRDKIFSLYEKSIVALKSSNQKFKDEQYDEVVMLLADSTQLFDAMKKVRSNYQKPCKSKAEALKRRENKTQHVVDAAFKFLDKFGYIDILKNFVDLHYSIKDDRLSFSQDEIFHKILDAVKNNISTKMLQDSEDEEFLGKLEEADLCESAKDLVKISVIAGLMAMSSLLPSRALTKELSNAKKNTPTMTIDSPVAKKAIENAAKDNEMLGPMSKTNVANLVAQVLWKEARGNAEGTIGREAVASVILNRTGDDPSYLVDVIKQPDAFSCMNAYTGGWTDATYQFFVPWKELSSNPANKAIWEDCKSIAEKLVNKTFKSTIGNLNSYLNKKTAKKKAVDTWGTKCTKKIGSHHFGYLPEHDPKYVKPGTMTTWKQLRKNDNGKFVVVKNGDTLGKIAKDNKTQVAQILKLNPALKNPNKISIGQKIRVA